MLAVQEPDIYTKTNEFYAWLIGERMINPETLPKSKEKDEFKVYMEAYNTGTLPEKYVDIGKHEAKMAAIRSGETVVNDDRYDPNKDLEGMHVARLIHRIKLTVCSSTQPSAPLTAELQPRRRRSSTVRSSPSCAKWVACNR